MGKKDHLCRICGDKIEAGARKRSKATIEKIIKEKFQIEFRYDPRSWPDYIHNA